MIMDLKTSKKFQNKQKTKIKECENESESDCESVSNSDSDSDSEDKKKCKNNDRIKFTKSLNKIAQIEKDFHKAVESFGKISNGHIIEIIENIETKTKEYEILIELKDKLYKNKEKELDEKYTNKDKELDEKYKNKKKDLQQEHKRYCTELDQDYKNKQIETVQQLKEYQIEACEKIASENNYNLIAIKDYEKILSERDSSLEKLAEYELSSANLIKEKIEMEKLNIQEKLKQDTIVINLNHKAEIADSKAQINQQLKEIEFLNKLILNLTNEVSEQRNLTKEIAIASSKSQITQSFTKDK